MVKNTGKTLCPDAFRPVNLPEPMRVEEDRKGQPRAVQTPRRQQVIAIEDMWRLDDEWWRLEPVSRMYYVMQLASGQRIVVYRDLPSGKWYRQSY